MVEQRKGQRGRCPGQGCRISPFPSPLHILLQACTSTIGAPARCLVPFSGISCCGQVGHRGLGVVLQLDRAECTVPISPRPVGG